MRRGLCVGVVVALLAGMVCLAPSNGRAGVLDHLWESGPSTLADVARMIDHIQNQILNQGTVVVKQPDVWSQARMTMFRKEFENTMQPELGKFYDYLSARIARSDSAALQSQTSLGAALDSLTPGQSPAPVVTPDTIKGERTDAVALLGTSSTLPLPINNPGNANPPPTSAVAQNFSLLNSLVPVGTQGGTVNPIATNLGVEPNVHIDEKADFITHLQRLRRINLGDDNSDSAGYGLYLMRVPVSIQPGDKTKKGFGAIVNMTMRHDFGPKFLPATYRNLVINDLVDQLGPFVHELIRNGKAKKYNDEVQKYLAVRKNARDEEMQKVYEEERAKRGPNASLTENERVNVEKRERVNVEKRTEERTDVQKVFENLKTASENQLKTTSNFSPVGRTGPRTYAIAPTDVKRVFVAQNLLNLAFEAQQSLDLGTTEPPKTNKVRSTEVRSYLRHELESAFDLMEGRCREQPAILSDVPYIESLTDQVYCRKFEGPKGAVVDSNDELNGFYGVYHDFSQKLPGNLRYRSIGVLSWGIAVQAGLLNRQLHEDMKQTKGADGYLCPPDVDTMPFYTPDPAPEVIHAFEEYVKARWPMITFSLEPVTDEQNIDDAFTRRRDLQLAIAFALSSGRLSFRQATQYTRQLQYEAQTIALNQTVSAFAHGNDTFGWRFTPRYQTPPEESNLRAVTNLLLRGGPGPNWTMDNSKIEPGMRELTAVVVMPSFVRGMRLDVSGDWFRLHDPDERKLHTARTVELGRKINEARDSLEAACKCGKYRPEDVERLRMRLHQLEVMLPMQTQHVNVPYENLLGGFALFTQGQTALVPELSGFEGVEYLDTTKANDIIVYGKHFSIYETDVVVGGVRVPREGMSTFVTRDVNGNLVQTSQLSTAMRDPDKGNLIILGSDGKTVISVKDVGSYDIMSREVMRVRIPANVSKAKREDGQDIIEVYVATPNGISNKMQIPVKDPDKPAPAPVFTPTTAPGYTFVDTSIRIGVNVTNTGTAASPITGFVSVRKFPPGSQVRIQPTDLTPPLPKAVDIQMTFTVGSGANVYQLPIIIPNVPLVPADTGDTYIINSDLLDKLATQLFASINANKIALPTAALTPKSLIKPVANPAGPPPATFATTNDLTVNFDQFPPSPTSSRDRKESRRALARASDGDDPFVSRTGLRGESTFESAAELADPASGLTPLASTNAGLLDPALIPAPIAELREIRDRLEKLETSQPSPAPAPTTQTVITAPQRPPTVNVTVPITNVSPGKHQGMLHHRASTTGGRQVPSTRGPILERLMGRP